MGCEAADPGHSLLTTTNRKTEQLCRYTRPRVDHRSYRKHTKPLNRTISEGRVCLQRPENRGNVKNKNKKVYRCASCSLPHGSEIALEPLYKVIVSFCFECIECWLTAHI